MFRHGGALQLTARGGELRVRVRKAAFPAGGCVTAVPEGRSHPRTGSTRCDLNLLSAMLRVTRNVRSVISLLVLAALISLFFKFFGSGSRSKISPEFLSISGLRLGMSRQEVTKSLGVPTGSKSPWTVYHDVFVVYDKDTVIAVMGRALQHKGVSVSIGDDGLLVKDGILIQHWKEFLWNDCVLGPPTYFGLDSSKESKYGHGARYEHLKLTLTERNYHLQCILEPHSSLERLEGGMP